MTTSSAGNRSRLKESRSRGFTLIELLMVMLVVALVLAVSYPSLSRGAGVIQLRTAARDVLNVFRYAREKAVTEQTGMRVVVDREKQQVILTDDLGEGPRRYVPPRNVRIERIALAGTEIAEGPMIIRFLPNGSAESAEVLLRSSTGSSMRVFTDPITGGARIERGPGENER